MLGCMKMQIHIRDVAESRGIANASQLWRHIGGSQESAAQLWKGEFKMIGIGTLEKLCALLECQPGDLLTYASEDAPVKTVRRTKRAMSKKGKTIRPLLTAGV